jgi:hypothetical protein
MNGKILKILNLPGNVKMRGANVGVLDGGGLLHFTRLSIEL